MTLSSSALAQTAMDDCLSSDHPSTLFQSSFSGTCDIKGIDACFVDAIYGNIVCNFDDYPCDTNSGVTALAFNYKKNAKRITILGTCREPNSTDDFQFCCVHDQSNGGVITKLTLNGTDRTEEQFGFSLLDDNNTVHSLVPYNSNTQLGARAKAYDGYDYIRGSYCTDSNYTESLEGGDGIDVIRGFDGDDYIYGGSQGDSLYGGNGDDWIYGNKGDDDIWGDAGSDHLFGQNHNDTIDGGSQRDFIYGGNGSDILLGKQGDDEMFGGRGNDTMEGGIGNDKMHGGDGNDTLEGGDGIDWLYGGYDHDGIWGGDDNDVICENHARALLAVGSSHAAVNYISGGGGSDTLYLNTYTAVPGGMGGPYGTGFPGDGSLENGYGSSNVSWLQLTFDAQGDGPYDPNAAECLYLVNTFGR